MAGAILLVLGILAGLAVLCAIIIAWWAVRHCKDGAGSANDGGGGGGAVSSTTITGRQGQETLLNKDDADAVTDEPGGSGQRERERDPEPSDGAAVELCAICKAALADASWGRRRRLRPCGHVFHADCVGLWLQRKWICPVCRAAVAMSRPEILDDDANANAMV